MSVASESDVYAPECLGELIDDMIWEIMQRLSYRERRVFASVNKRFSAFYRRKKLGGASITGVNVFFGKRELLDDILKNRKRIISITAPPSWGKTLFTFLMPFHFFPLGEPVKGDIDRFVIAVPNKLITLYKDEIMKRLPAALNVKEPEKSAIIIDDKCLGKHYNYLFPQNGVKTKLSEHNRVIIVPHRFSLDIDPNLGILSDKMTIIVDEAHIGTIVEQIIPIYKNRIILFSATPWSLTKDLEAYKAKMHSYIIPRDDISDLLPKNIFHSSQKPLDVLIERNLAKRSKILVICTDAKDMVAKITTIVDTLYNDSNRPAIYRFAKSIQKINRFTNYKGKAILVAEYSKIDVGFSILAEAAILNDCDRIGYERLYQIVSRLIRITNNTKQVFITVRFLDGDTFFMRIKKALVNIKLQYDVSVSKDYLTLDARNRALAILNELKINYEELSDPELIMCVAPNAASLKQMFIDYNLIDSPLRKEILMRLFY